MPWFKEFQEDNKRNVLQAPIEGRAAIGSPNADSGLNFKRYA
jgi:hypothetical protein